MENQIKCPKCSSTQITANNKGFSAKQAVGGALLTGGIGLAAGGIGSNKVIITCLACAHQFKPGGDMKALQKKREQEAEALKSPAFWVILVVLFLAAGWLFKGCF